MLIKFPTNDLSFIKEQYTKKGLEIFEMQGNDSKRYTSQVVV
jgi:hypothetical protein